MAILNEIPIMSEFNIRMLIGGLIAIPIGAIVLLPVLRFDDISNIRIFLSLIVGIALIGGGLTSLILYEDPDYQIPTGKTQIEATFALGRPSAYILEKYDVIEQRGRIWVLEEK